MCSHVATAQHHWGRFAFWCGWTMAKASESWSTNAQPYSAQSLAAAASPS